MPSLPLLEIQPKSGAEPFTHNGQSLSTNLRGFWQWFASDLVSNTMRGMLAEYIVALALDCTHNLRQEWDAFDLLTANGAKVEVKSSAYIQSWAQDRYSPIRFGIQPNKAGVRQADLYVFCLLAHRQPETINPLDLDQWEFYVLSTAQLDSQVGLQKSISLGSLKRLKPLTAKFATLAETITQVSPPHNAQEKW